MSKVLSNLEGVPQGASVFVPAQRMAFVRVHRNERGFTRHSSPVIAGCVVLEDQSSQVRGRRQDFRFINSLWIFRDDNAWVVETGESLDESGASTVRVVSQNEKTAQGDIRVIAEELERLVTAKRDATAHRSVQHQQRPIAAPPASQNSGFPPQALPKHGNIVPANLRPATDHRLNHPSEIDHTGTPERPIL